MPTDVASKKGVTIIANRLFHPRILKAVVKEKWMDLGYKISNDPYIAVLTHESDGSKLTFYLTQKRKITGADL